MTTLAIGAMGVSLAIVAAGIWHLWRAQTARGRGDARINRGERLVVNYRSLQQPTPEEAQAFARHILARARARGSAPRAIDL